MSRAAFVSLWLAVATTPACKRTERRVEPESGPGAAGPATAGAMDAAPASAPASAPARRAATGTDVATGRRGAVTSAEKHATAVGRAVLERGGNAVDAAVAVALALGVTHPAAGNIGGGGFMVIRFPDGRATTIDYREVAPGRASRDMYLDAAGKPTQDSRRGPRAAGIPGDVAGLALAHSRYGTLPWKELVAPAIALARDGHEIDVYHWRDLSSALAKIEAFAAELAGANGKSDRALRDALAATRALFSAPDGTRRSIGDRWAQPDLAATLEVIASDPVGFYRGPLAEKMAAAVRKMGGLWTATDLAGYRAIERDPIVFEYRGHTVITMAPPSAGGVTLRQIFAASETLKLYELEWDSVDRIHLYVEALRRIYADRNQLIADPAFVDVPVARLVEPSYVASRMADINRARATPSSVVSAGIQLDEKTETTHFSVVDGSGMAVANTFTLNGSFGAKVAIPGTGVLLNNEMDDFTAKVGTSNMFGLVQGAQNAIAPGKRMVSSMTPTIVARRGALRAVCGSPGGPKISTTVAQVLLQILDHGRTLDQAVAATRIHHQWLPDSIDHEPTLSLTSVQELRRRGHQLDEDAVIGHANCIEVDPKTGELRAVADTGRDGGDADAF